MSGTVFCIILAVLAFAVVVPILCNFTEDALNGFDDGHGRRHREFHDQRRMEGVSHGERQSELFLREIMAGFRREASDAVQKDPVLWYEAIEKAQQEAFDKVARHDRMLLTRFGDMIRGMSYGHILYPHEAKMVDRLMSGHALERRPTDDQVAALRIVH